MKTLLRLLGFIRPYWWGPATSVALILTLTFFRLGPAWFTKEIIDKAVPAHDFTLALWYVAGLLGVSLLVNLFSAVYVSRTIFIWLTSRRKMETLSI